jgi:benzoate transport
VSTSKPSSIAMSPIQWRMVLLCVWLNVIDGIDVMVAAFTATAIAGEWELSGTALGWLLSIGFLGMTAGSLCLAPLSDRWGRRPMLLLCLVVCGVSMIAVQWCQTPWQLGLFRFIAGLGIGGILASSNVLCNEYASRRNKGLAVSFLSVGYAMGATLGGVIALSLTQSHGWRFVFVFAGALTLLTGVIMYKYLYESITFLRERTDLTSQHQLQRILNTVPAQYISDIEDTTVETSSQSWTDVVRGGRAAQSMCLWLAIALTMFGFQFVMSWTPKLMTQSGFSAESGMSAGIVLSVGGMIGAIALGFASRKFSLSRLQGLFLGATTLVTLLFMISMNHPQWIWIVGLLLGILINGCVASLYAFAPMLYPSQLRTTGVGISMGLGRIGGIVSPLVAGMLLDWQWQPAHLYGFYAGAFALALLATLYLTKRTSSSSSNTGHAGGQILRDAQ